MHPRTPQRLARFAETHRQVGAICNAAVWVEYQLEVAISELDGTFELDPDNQGRYWTELTKRMRQLLEGGAVDDSDSTASLLQLVTEVREAMNQRDAVAHSTWLINNDTRPGHVTGQRYRRRNVEIRDWHPDELEQIREDLEAVYSRLISEPWNAVTPPEKHV